MTNFKQACQTTTVDDFYYWKKRAVKNNIYDHISSFETRTIFNLHPKAIKEVIERSGNPLTGLSIKNNTLPNFATPWPVVYFFDIITESMGIPPTWKQYWSLMNSDYKEYWIEYAIKKYPNRKVIKAIKWRLAKAYISWMKELYIFTSLIDKGYNVHKHTYADIEGKVDIFTVNPTRGILLTVKSNWDTRKRKPSIPYHTIYLPVFYDNVNWVPKDEHIKEAEKWLTLT